MALSGIAMGLWSCKALFKSKTARVLSVGSSIGELNNGDLITHSQLSIASQGSCPRPLAIENRVTALKQDSEIQISLNPKCTYKLDLKLGSAKEQAATLSEVYLELVNSSKSLSQAQLSDRPSSLAVEMRLTAQAKAKGISLKSSESNTLASPQRNP